jgi:putative flippase GtrA
MVASEAGCVSRSLGSKVASLVAHIPAGQLRRYLLVGVWNTVFAYGAYAWFTKTLSPHLRYGYVAASLLASLLNITVAFLGYKWFVFRTKGNYLSEWCRCVMVYSGTILLGMVLLPPVVLLVGYATGRPKAAPYWAGLLLMGVNVVINFFGQKKVSFRA